MPVPDVAPAIPRAWVRHRRPRAIAIPAITPSAVRPEYRIARLNQRLRSQPFLANHSRGPNDESAATIGRRVPTSVARPCRIRSNQRGPAGGPSRLRLPAIAVLLPMRVEHQPVDLYRSRRPMPELRQEQQPAVDPRNITNDEVVAMNLPLQMDAVCRDRFRRSSVSLKGQSLRPLSPSSGPTCCPEWCYSEESCRTGQGPCPAHCYKHECCRPYLICLGLNSMICRCDGNNAYACCNPNGSCICTGNMPGCGS
jgi:hypothetical protein